MWLKVNYLTFGHFDTKTREEHVNKHIALLNLDDYNRIENNLLYSKNGSKIWLTPSEANRIIGILTKGIKA